MNEDHEVLSLLDATAKELTRLRAPDEVEQNLMRAFRARKGRRRGSGLATLAAAAALVIALAGVALFQVRFHHAPQTVTAPPSAENVPFVAIAGANELGTLESGYVVAVEIPTATLIAYGIPVESDDLDALVPAEILIGQDGVPRAIRRRIS